VPTYQYACTACDERLDVVQKFSDDALTECLECGGRLRKIFSPAGIIFKGSGFYRTDSRGASKSASATAAEKKSESTTTSDSTSSSSSDSSGSSSSTASSSSTDSSSSSGSSSSSSSGSSEKVA
jgi:putative FmdB family regulatory protein